MPKLHPGFLLPPLLLLAACTINPKSVNSGFSAYPESAQPLPDALPQPVPPVSAVEPWPEPPRPLAIPHPVRPPPEPLPRPAPMSSFPTVPEPEPEPPAAATPDPAPALPAPVSPIPAPAAPESVISGTAEPVVAAPPPPIEPPAVTGPPAAILALRNEAEQSFGNGDYDNAALALERAIRIQPGNSQLWQRLAEIRLRQGQPRLAEDLARKSNLHARGDTELMRRNWSIIAEARRLNGDPDGAAAAEAKALGGAY